MRNSMLLAAVIAVMVGCSSDTTAPPPIDNTPHVGYFVTVNGSPTGDGSAANPWDLATALAQPGIVQPGDTIWLRAGTYKGNFVSKLTGTAAAPIILRQYPGEHAIVDGDFEAIGSYTWYWGFEALFSDPQRISTVVGSDPTDLPRYGKAVGSKVNGSFNKFINLVVHDMANGPGDNSNAHGTEIYGNIIYNNGWIGPDRAHGHGIYIQNQVETKRIADNVIFDNFEDGMQIGGSDAAFIMNMMIEGNSMFCSGAPALSQFGWQLNAHVYGGGPNLGNITFRNNSFYQISPNSNSVHLGEFQSDIPDYPITFTDNRVQGTTEFNEWKKVTFLRNRMTTGDSALSGQSRLAIVRLPQGTPMTAYQWDANTYTSLPTSINILNTFQNGVGLGYADLRSWQTATGWDQASTLSQSLSPDLDVVVRPNDYESGRGLITIWNPAALTTAQVDVSSILKIGDSFEVHHVYDVYGTPVLSGVYSGGSVAIPLRSYDPPIPIGMTARPVSAGINFNVFLIQKR